MNWINISLIFPLLTVVTSSHFPEKDAEPNKIALIVAVSDYPLESGWPKLNSSNDVPLVKDALIKQGFSEENIAVVTDVAATKEGIISAIRTHLVKKAQKGGVAYFHFSGHGQQVADDNSDEIDGFDEAMVPINSPLRFEPGIYEGQNLIRDDQLGKLLYEVRRKLGKNGNLLTVIDACHSGTGTRGMAPARGTTVKMAPPGYQPSSVKDKDETGAMDNLTDGDNLAPMAAFFGAAPHQLNYEATDAEGRRVGSLSYAFSKKFASASSQTSYRGLFEQIKLEMSAIAPLQQPQAEGMLDQQILGGQILGATEHFTIKKVSDSGQVVLEGGWLHGINEGTVIGFFEREERDPWHNAPLTRGTVLRSNPIDCIVKLETDLDPAIAETAWAYVLEQNFGNLEINLKIDLPPNHPVGDALKREIEKKPVIKQNSTPELFVVLSPSGDEVQLISGNDLVLETFSATMATGVIAARLVDAMLTYVQAKFLRGIELTSFEIPVDMEIIPVEWDKNLEKEIREFPLQSKKDKAGNIRFKTDEDVFKLKITNLGSKAAYFTLIDIMPDNKVQVLIPDPKQPEQPQDFKLAPGQSYTSSCFHLEPPLGTEIFKLIATDQPIDLRPVSTSRGQTRDPSSSPFEKMFAQTYFNEDCMTRGGKTLSVAAANVHICSVVFTIE